MIPPGRRMTLQHNHHQPNIRRRLRRGLERLSPDPYVEVLSGSNQETMTSSSMTPSSKRLITGLDRSKLSFRPESFAKALVNLQGTEGGTHRQFRPGLDRRGQGACRLPPHCVEPSPDSPAIVGGMHQQSSMPGRRRQWGLAGRRHTTQSRSRTRP